MSPFKFQMFASPGIRKDRRNNQELGEDATGFVYAHDWAVLWIADGAPGRNVEFEGSNFNSRILAKCMGECFETVALRYEIPRTPLDDVFGAFTNELYQKLSELLAGIDECLRQSKDSVNLDDILEVKMNGKEKTYVFKWSTTFVGAIIDIKNKVCYTMSMGDCFALVNNEFKNKVNNEANETNDVSKVNETDGFIKNIKMVVSSTLNKHKQPAIEPTKTISSMDILPAKFKIITGKANRVFIEWSIKANLDPAKIDIISGCPRIETIVNLDSIILMSDGVISVNDIESKFVDKDVETIWGDLKSMNNKTDDDKTALFFNILEQR